MGVVWWGWFAIDRTDFFFFLVPGYMPEFVQATLFLLSYLILITTWDS